VHDTDPEYRPPGATADRLVRALLGLALLIVAALGVRQWVEGPVTRVDRELPTLSLSEVDSPTPLTLTEGRPTVLHVWLPGCGACAAEAPAYEAVRRRYEAAGVDFVALSVVPDAASTRRAADRYGLRGTVATSAGSVLDRIQVGSVPSTVWISGEGRVVAVAEGPQSERILDRETARLLQ